jgi:hypothetical protein
MAYAIGQVGTTLLMVDTSGALTTLTLPTGVTLSSLATRRPRFANLGRNTLIVNSPSRSLWVDEDRTVRSMSIQPPGQAPTLSGVTAGSLSGNFRVKVAFLVVNEWGDVLSHSALGPASDASGAIAAKLLRASGIPVSRDPAVNARRLYRTTTGPGDEYFPWLDLDGNEETVVEDDLSDAGLELVAAPTDLGSPPGTTGGGSRLTLIAEWANRLWAVSSSDPDTLLYSADGKLYAWPPDNFFPIPPKGRDQFGVTALIPRRDQLGVTRVDCLHQITGKSNATFSRVKVVEGVGCVAPETVFVYRDTAFFLGQDGVYRWDSNGVKSVSDENAKAYFTTDDYFDRSKFDQAWASFDPTDNSYVLFLTSVGGTLGDRWLKYMLDRQTWWGPHKTGAFTPTAAGVVSDASDQLRMVIGGSTGFFWKDRGRTFTDDVNTAIDFDADLVHTGDTPDIEKYWGQATFIVKPQAAGNLVITPTVGDLSAAATPSINVDLTRERSRIRRFGPGRHLQLNLRQNVDAQGCELRGYEVPYISIGRRGGL